MRRLRPPLFKPARFVPKRAWCSLSACVLIVCYLHKMSATLICPVTRMLCCHTAETGAVGALHYTVHMQVRKQQQYTFLYV